MAVAEGQRGHRTLECNRTLSRLVLAPYMRVPDFQNKRHGFTGSGPSRTSCSQLWAQLLLSIIEIPQTGNVMVLGPRRQPKV